MHRIKFVNGTFVLAFFLFELLIFIAAPVSAADRQPYASAQARVMTEGLTAEQHVQKKSELSKKLLNELPSAAAKSIFRIPLTEKDVAAIDRPLKSSVPLKIGLVRPLTSRIEISGLTRRTSQREVARGKREVAESTRDGGFVWAAIVGSENAGAIRVHVQDMSLANHVELYIYSRDGQAYGPYTGKGPRGTGEFWTATIFGKEAILQIRGASNADLNGNSFRVSEAGVITQRFATGLGAKPKAKPAPGFPCGNESCVVDASCVNTQQKLAEAKMEWVQGAYIYTCSGGLISDTNPTQSNFFLTANHCVSKNNSAQNVNFYWRFATSSCNATSCPSNSGWPYITSGSTVAKTGRKGDFTLLHLNANPPSGSVFLGWNSAPVANTNGADLFRVSNPNFGPQVYSEHEVDTSAGTCSGWPRGERIYSRDIVGAIDGGSSGSPIVNNSLQIVGQLSGTCGTNPTAVCSSGPGEANATVDGAFAFYFSLVQPILAP